MANFYVTHNKYPQNPQLFTVTVTKLRKKGGEDNPNFKPSYPTAEPYWELLIHTSGKDASGDPVGPVVVSQIGSATDIQELIDTKVEELCSQIDWSQQGEYQALEDKNAPRIVSQSPSPGEQNVPIDSSIVLNIEDKIPADGIDISTLTFKVDGHIVNPTVIGNKYNYTIVYRPRPVYSS